MRSHSWSVFGALLAFLIAPLQGGADEGPLSPIVVTPVPQQRIVPVLGSDNRYHVLYELQLTNTLGEAAELRQVDILTQRAARRCSSSTPKASSRANICTRSTARPLRASPSRRSRGAF